jgi:O-antigen ligase
MISRIGALALLLPLWSAISSPAVPLTFRLLLVLLWGTAIVRPHWATGALIVLVPFASWMLLVTGSPPVRYAEALVLATLSGLLVAAARPRRTRLRAQRPDLAAPALLFCAVVASSAAVMLAIMQTGANAPGAFARHFLVFLTHDYLVGPPGTFPGIADAALLLEGVGLAFLVARHARDHVARPARLLMTTAVAAAGAAVLTGRAWLASASAADSAAGAVRLLLRSRASVHVADLNAAGSTFAMAGCLALALAINSRWTGRPRRPALVHAAWAAVAALLVLAVWLTGSRMAILAIIGSAGIGMLWVVRPGTGRWPLRAAAAALVLAIAALALGVDPRPSASRTAAHMLSMRADFMVTGLRMMRSAPIFGVGIGRYFEMSGQFMPSSIYWFYFHENAHNNFLQVGGELGAVGLAAFLWLLTSAAIRLARGLRADPGDRLLIGATAGLGAFVATWATSHPLLVPEVAYPFWILAGVAIARADGDAQAAPSGPVSADAEVRRSSALRDIRPATALAGVAIVALAMSVPVRARQAIAGLDLTTQSWGFYDWEGQGPERNRWTSRRATFFAPPDARELQLPMRAMHIGTNTGPVDVSIAIGGRPFHHLVLDTGDWVSVRLRLPPRSGGEGFQRIDIITDPTWSPAVLFGGRSDVRVLGVQVGEATFAP